MAAARRDRSIVAAEVLRLVVVPPELAQRVYRLGRYVTYLQQRRATLYARRHAIKELDYLRGQLLLTLLDGWFHHRDNAAERDAHAWVEADRAEVEAELLETMRRAAPQRDGESVDAYVDRLRTVVARFRKGN